MACTSTFPPSQLTSPPQWAPLMTRAMRVTGMRLKAWRPHKVRWLSHQRGDRKKGPCQQGGAPPMLPPHFQDLEALAARVREET